MEVLARRIRELRRSSGKRLKDLSVELGVKPASTEYNDSDDRRGPDAGRGVADATLAARLNTRQAGPARRPARSVR